MKRSPHLMQLSREHHTALLLAKRAQRLGKGTAAEAAAFMSELPDIFGGELEPHFQVEEIALLSALQNSGGTEHVVGMVERTVAEHEALRALARRIGAHDFASLAPFGELLDAHVRFEERELFGLAESLLTAEALARIEAAAQWRGSDRCPAVPS